MAQLKDLIVTGAARFLGTIYGTLKGNADTATKATQDSAGQQIDTTYIKDLSTSGKTVTYTKGDGTTGSITTQDTTYSNATTKTAGLMSAEDKTALDNLGGLVGDTAVSAQISDYAAPKSHTHSSYVNQNAFSNVVVGSTTVAADSATDTLTLVAGSNVTLTPDATNDKITIAAKDTVYTHPTTSGNKHIPSGGSSGQILRWSADGTAAWDANTLESTSGTLDISKGGTGATNASGACSNIGALSASGGSMNGGINFENKQNGIEWTTADGTRFWIRPYPDGNILQITRTPGGATSEDSAFSIDSNGHILFKGMQPLEIGSGGTGSTTASGACSNIGALSASGGKMTGFAEVDNGNYAGMRWYCADGSKFDLRAIGGANTFQVTVTNGETELGAFNIDSTGHVYLAHALPVTSGGTGAGTAADARDNLEVPHFSNGMVEVWNQGGIGTSNDLGYSWRLWNLDDGSHEHFPAALHPSQNGSQLLGTWDYRIKEVWANNYPCGTWNGDAVAIDHGGTGATTASGACANIGAFPATGGTLNGSINFGATINGLNWTTANGTGWQVRPWHDTNLFQIVRHGTDGNWYGDFTIDCEGNVSLTKALPITSGGTGASNTADALRNLGIQYSSSQPAVIEGGIWLKPV